MINYVCSLSDIQNNSFCFERNGVIFGYTIKHIPR